MGRETAATNQWKEPYVRRVAGVAPPVGGSAFFADAGGYLEVVTVEGQATHSLVEFQGRDIVVPYRADATMELDGNQLNQLVTPNVDNQLLLLWAPGQRPTGFAFARATTADETRRYGGTRTVAAGVPRSNHWITDPVTSLRLPSLLMEPAEAETLSMTWGTVPRSMQVYAQFLGGANVSGLADGATLWRIGGAGARCGVDVQIGVLRAFHHNGTSLVESLAALAPAPTVGQRVEVLLTLSAAGVQIHQSVNGAAAVAGGASGALTLAGAWSASTLHLGTDHAGANAGPWAFRGMVAHVDTTKTIDYFREVTRFNP